MTIDYASYVFCSLVWTCPDLCRFYRAEKVIQAMRSSAVFDRAFLKVEKLQFINPIETDSGRLRDRLFDLATHFSSD